MHSRLVLTLYCCIYIYGVFMHTSYIISNKTIDNHSQPDIGSNREHINYEDAVDMCMQHIWSLNSCIYTQYNVYTYMQARCLHGWVN